MTNEEKIIEILDKHFGYHVTQGSDEWYTRNYQNRFLDLQEMVEWKDEQIDTILLTIEGFLRNFFAGQGNSQESINYFISALKMQINENLEKL